MTDNDKLFKIFGADELVKVFKEFDEKIQTKILTTSFKKASLLIIDEAKGNLKGGYRHIKASFGTKAKRDINTLQVGSLKRSGGGFAHIVNKGTKERSYITSKGNLHKTGRIIGNQFWDDAVNNTEKSVEDAIYKDIKSQFDKLLQKRNRVK